MSYRPELVENIKKAVERIKAGQMVIMVDDEDRENEGDLVIAAQFANAENINFMAKNGRGLICLALENSIADQLDLPPMVVDNQSRFGTAFTVSIEAKCGVTTGISAADRATTIMAAVKEGAVPTDLARPGHVFPLRAKDGGVLVRTGQTEGSVDLTRIAGLKPAAVICEIMNDNGTMARMPELREFSAKYDIPIITIEDIIAYRLMTESLVEQMADAVLPTKWGGDFNIKVFKSMVDGLEHVALIKGDITTAEPVLVRVHSECLTGDALGSVRCDCGYQLQNAMEIIDREGRGVILYLRQEGRGIGLGNKIKAYHLQDNGMDTVEANIALGFPADMRDYGIGAQILKEIGVKRIKLLTNNPKKMVSLAGYGLEITDQIPNICGVQEKNIKYLMAKQNKMGHKIFSKGDEHED
ncbi:MAG TPA: bifunctional 3,4-dihydroxy-2-butanone-4-phosphate synthase/GTP cyclohydrolase II [bacterium]|jgi:3,4-dihydroxy 2-butanone 4-phosphate synthase/GTP cyclohydrolase II|nr:bifunctional 3,4-dihydroxy-2-butanone-4-phosphate synthase/GTP cyclohydrolase II [bacterium]HOG43027.1 bifunctional 3,4-dihydroxy-2-butanone-4-phosphate synthase/GTP cyclohydrolase II [bacterium]HPY13444.1 bifunctional 3,4-dihydroxy-2-butanone-4-phosphate synthase/GTP cyclohydrolase II [bacterium]HQB10257.1 bifunctional 3,4-dihydroxy-2-butanone-4-phosphate synthase/GTP cyclohydrolase II [bacterium]HQM84393.1 bifunctional 3,4-dihydroxy-2-butanone-4-phosphate synthase/GTP cyclohydrolase II [ba